MCVRCWQINFRERWILQLHFLLCPAFFPSHAGLRLNLPQNKINHFGKATPPPFFYYFSLPYFCVRGFSSELKPGWTVRGMLPQVTFFPGRHTISKAEGLFHGHVWLILLFCFVSPSLRPQWLHTLLIQTHTHTDRGACLPPSNSVTFFSLYVWYFFSHPHTPWPLGSWFSLTLPRI